MYAFSWSRCSDGFSLPFQGAQFADGGLLQHIWLHPVHLFLLRVVPKLPIISPIVRRAAAAVGGGGGGIGAPAAGGGGSGAAGAGCGALLLLQSLAVLLLLLVQVSASL
jgi:hypothetical protein